MREVLGLHSPVQGATEPFKRARDNIGASCVLWTAAHGPQDATAGVTNLVRLPTLHQDESTAAYVGRVHDQIARWYASGIPAIFIPGNEPDLAESSGDVPVAWSRTAWEGAMAAIAPALRDTWGGIVLGAPAYSVGEMARYSQAYADRFDVLTAHAYWWAHKDEAGDMAAGAAWQHAAGYGKPVYVTEANSNPTAPDQLGAWAATLPETVAGVCFYICDDAGHDPQYNVTPEQAAAIRAAYEEPAVVDPAPPPDPPAPIPPPVPPPARTGAYSRSTNPRGYRALDPRWLPFIRLHNPDEADAICAAYAEAARRIDYDANCMIAQGCVETEMFTSPRWRNAHAAAGVGIYGDGTPDVIWGPLPHGDVQTGIRAQADLLTAYFGDDAEPFGTLAPHGFGGMTLHKTTLSDMDGVWAADRGYSAAIVGYLDAVLGGEQPAPAAGGKPLVSLRDVALADVGDTMTDEGNPEFEWCEQKVGDWLRRDGLTVTFYTSAAQHGDDAQARGILRAGPWIAGAVVIMGRAFDPQGHIFVGDTFPFAITTYKSGRVERIDATDWFHSPGYLGYYIPEGLSEEGDMALPLDGKADDGVWAHGWAVAMRQPDNKINRTGIFNRWLALVKEGVAIGVPICDEYAFPDGRVCQNFSSGAVMTAIRQDDGSYQVFVN